MAEEFQVSKAKTEFVGIFSMDDYYKLLFDLFMGLGYSVEETKYSHKTSPTGDSMNIEWNCFKKVDDYSLFKIWAKTEVRNLEKVQVQIGEKQSIKHKGICSLELKCFVVTDYENRWEINPFLKLLKGIYDVYFYKSTFDSWKEKVTIDMHTVENEIKSFFNMQRFM